MKESSPRRLGKYEILDELGKGGFATVYRAHDPDLDREVALKVLDPLLTRDPVWVARFRREARAVARLEHAHVVTIYEVGEAEGMLYIAARLVEAGSLAQRIAQEGALPWSEVVQLVSQIAEALDYAHAQGIVHRDLKTANILLDPRAGALLTDFGFAKLVGESSVSVSVSGGVVGTPCYIAPEVWEGKPTMPQTDVYALGCILYEMVTGEHLFQGDTTPAVMLAHFQPLELPEEWPEGVPPRLAEVLETALVKEPEARYERAGELARALAVLKEDALAAPYAALEAAVAAEAWDEALALSRKIQAEAPNYRDVAALEEAALDGLERAARAREAATWREEAERALAQGELREAKMAARQWQALVPDDTEAEAFLVKLQEPVERPPAPKAAPSVPSVVPSTSLREKPCRRVPGWIWAVVGLALLLSVVGSVIALNSIGRKPSVVTGEITSVVVAEATNTPKPSGTPTLTTTTMPHATKTPPLVATSIAQPTSPSVSPTAEPSPNPKISQWETFSDPNDISDLFLDGFTLWAATKGGLVQWDIRDNSHHVITVDEGLPTNDLNAVCIDASGTVWVGSATAGLLKLEDDQWITVAGKDVLGSNTIQDIIEDKDSNVWVATAGGGASRFDGSAWARFTPDNSTVDENVYVIYVDEDGSLWFGSGEKSCWLCGGDLAHYDGQSWERFGRDNGIPVPTDPSLAQDASDVWDILRVPDGSLWVATPGGLGRYRSGEWEVINASFTTGLLLDGDSVWVTSEEGINKYDGMTGQQQSKDGSAAGLVGIATDMILTPDGTILAGGVWLGGHGLLQRSSTGEWHEHTLEASIGGFVHEVGRLPNGTLSAVTYTSILNFDGQRWRPLYSANSSGVEYWGVALFASDGVLWVGGQGIASLSNGQWESDWQEYQISEIMEDRSGALWFSTMWQGAVLRYKDGEWTVYSHEMGTLPGSYVDSISQGQSGSVWIALNTGAVRIPPDGEKPDWQVFTSRDGLSSDDVMAVLEDRLGRYWFATRESIVMRSPDGTWQDFGDELGIEWVRLLEEDGHGNIWAGGGGLAMYQGGKWSMVLPKGTSVYDLLVAHDGTLWVSTWGDGVCQVRDGRPTCYTSQPYGLASNATSCVFEDIDHTIWVCTQGGLSHFDPR